MQSTAHLTSRNTLWSQDLFTYKPSQLSREHIAQWPFLACRMDHTHKPSLSYHVATYSWIECTCVDNMPCSRPQGHSVSPTSDSNLKSLTSKLHMLPLRHCFACTTCRNSLKLVIAFHAYPLATGLAARMWAKSIWSNIETSHPFAWAFLTITTKSRKMH